MARSAKLPPAALGVLTLLRLLPQVSAPATALLAASVLVLAALPVAIGIVTGLAIGAVPDAAAAGPGSDAAGRAFALLGIAGALIVLQRVLNPIQRALAPAFARMVDRHLQERLMAALGRPHGIAHLEDPEMLDLVRGAQGVGTEDMRPGRAVDALASLLPSWLQALGSAAVLLTFSPWLGLVWIVSWPILLGVLMREFIRVGEAGFGQSEAVRRSDYLRDLALTPGAAKELRVWGMTDFLAGRFEQAWLTAMTPMWRTRSPNRPILWLVGGAVFLLNLVAFALIGLAAVRGDIALAALAVYTRAVLEATAFRAFDDPNAHLAYAAVAVPKLLELERRLAAPEAPPRAILPADAPRASIRFEGVSFRYAGQLQDVLDGLDLEIAAGRSLAVVGANGAGKTTLIKLLCRLYEPTAGRVTVDGVDLADVDPASWQRRVAAIFQDFVQYHLSARANVAMTDGDAAALRRAAERAGALDLIEELPGGWDTPLSRRYTGGLDLSGGQWQRIALARALHAVDRGARVLILDEPTANLDVRAEAALYDRFLDITAGLTTILISHRFSTVRRADRIVVLEGGRVVEDGSHDELMALDGRYAEMFRLQAARFTDETAEADPEPASP